jgi:hypothetical protein
MSSQGLKKATVILLVLGGVVTLLLFLFGVREWKAISIVAAAWLLLPYVILFACTRYAETRLVASILLIVAAVSAVLANYNYAGTFSAEPQGFVGGVTIILISLVHLLVAIVTLGVLITVRKAGQNKVKQK